MMHPSQVDWAELLDTIKDILLQDESKLENNISFYKTRKPQNPKTPIASNERPKVQCINNSIETEGKNLRPKIRAEIE